VDITYQPAEQLGSKKEDRRAVFDLYCITENGEYYIIEMQVGQQTYFKDRALFYTAFPIRKQAPRNKNWNYQLKGVYLVAVLDFTLSRDKDDKDYVIEEVYLTRKRTKARFSDKLNFLFIELPKFEKSVAELETNTDKWLYCLKNMNSLNAIPEKFKGSIFEQMFDLARIDELTPTEMETYNKSLSEYNAFQDVAECNRNEGREEGIVEGKFEVARRMKEAGTSFSQITLFTNLSVEEIDRL
jgi:predicted transposase/invertase (TIGR01784 family)